MSGHLTTTDAAGSEEAIYSNELFYRPPGHNVKVKLDSEIVMFSSQQEHAHVINHMKEKTKG